MLWVAQKFFGEDIFILAKFWDFQVFYSPEILINSYLFNKRNWFLMSFQTVKRQQKLVIFQYRVLFVIYFFYFFIYMNFMKKNLKLNFPAYHLSKINWHILTAEQAIGKIYVDLNNTRIKKLKNPFRTMKNKRGIIKSNSFKKCLKKKKHCVIIK